MVGPPTTNVENTVVASATSAIHYKQTLISCDNYLDMHHYSILYTAGFKQLSTGCYGDRRSSSASEKLIKNQEH